MIDTRTAAAEKADRMVETARDTQEMTLLAGDALREDPAGGVCLIGAQCNECGAKLFPLATVCPECMSEKISEFDLSNRGSLYTWSVVHVAPTGWNVPYIAGYVDLPEGVRVFAHIVDVDPAALEIDMPVEVTTAILGNTDGTPTRSYAFTPIDK